MWFQRIESIQEWVMKPLRASVKLEMKTIQLEPRQIAQCFKWPLFVLPWTFIFALIAGGIS